MLPNYNLKNIFKGGCVSVFWHKFDRGGLNLLIIKGRPLNAFGGDLVKILKVCSLILFNVLEFLEKFILKLNINKN